MEWVVLKVTNLEVKLQSKSSKACLFRFRLIDLSLHAMATSDVCKKSHQCIERGTYLLLSLSEFAARVFCAHDAKAFLSMCL